MATLVLLGPGRVSRLPPLVLFVRVTAGQGLKGVDGEEGSEGFLAGLATVAFPAHAVIILHPKLIHPPIYHMLRLFRTVRAFSQLSRELTAHKYLRSISETALLYRPRESRQLSKEECLEDRVVQTFFDVSNVHIIVSEAAQRLKEIKDHSTPGHSFYQITLPFSENPNLRRKMIQFSNSAIRTGRLLELMDYIAANVAYRYCTPECDSDKEMDKIDFIMVTAAIDSIEFYYPITL